MQAVLIAALEVEASANAEVRAVESRLKAEVGFLKNKASDARIKADEARRQLFEMERRNQRRKK